MTEYNNNYKFWLMLFTTFSVALMIFAMAICIFCRLHWINFAILSKDLRFSSGNTDYYLISQSDILSSSDYITSFGTFYTSIIAILIGLIGVIVVLGFFMQKMYLTSTHRENIKKEVLKETNTQDEMIKNYKNDLDKKLDRRKDTLYEKFQQQTDGFNEELRKQKDALMSKMEEHMDNVGRLINAQDEQSITNADLIRSLILTEMEKMNISFGDGVLSDSDVSTNNDGLMLDNEDGEL